MVKKKRGQLDPEKIRVDPVYFIEQIIYAGTGSKLTSFQKEWLEIIEEKNRVCFMAFRSSGKTRQLFVHYFLWKAMVNPATQYLIISKTLPQAIEILKDIRITVLTCPLLKTMVPSNRSQAWSRTEIEFANHSRILSKAYNENVRGLHVDGLGCLTKEALVLSETRGAISIADVELGEKVLTHKNRFRTVLDTQKRKWSGKIYELTTSFGNSIRITGEHPVLTLSGGQKYFKRTKSLCVGDWVFIPDKGENPVVDGKALSVDRAYLMGWYAAEGCAGNMIRWTVHPSEVKLVRSYVDYEYGRSGVDSHHSHSHSVYLCDKRLAGLYREWFGHGAKNKRIPKFIFRASRQVQAAFIKGLLDGDGHKGVLYSSSLRLIEDFERLCSLIGLFCKRYKTKSNANSTFGGGLIYCSRINSSSLKMLMEINYSVKKRGFLWTRIKNLRVCRSNSFVYNLEVEEDNSYTANLLCVHNCDEMGEYQDHEVLKKAVLPTIRAKRGFFVGVGTPKSELDLLHEIERDPGFASIFFDRYPAEGNEKGELFAERYPEASIVHLNGSVEIRDKISSKLLETYNNMTWSQEFLLRPVSTDDKLFPTSMIEQCLDLGESFIESPVNMRQYFMGVDFAMSANAGADYTVITILEKHPGSKRLKIVYVDRFKGLDYSIQKQKIVELADRFQIVKALGDENNFGKVFIYDLKKEGVPIDGYKFSSSNKAKEEIVKALRDQFEKQGFIIPYDRNDAKTVLMVNHLIDELSKFGIIFDMRSKSVRFEGTGKHDDMVISLGLANFIARHVTMGLFTAVRGSQRKSSNNPFIVSKS